MADRKKILIVDDEEHFTQMVKLNLEATGNYSVETRNRGSEALNAAREFQPDLVLLDVMMPDMDGGTAASQIKEDPLTQGIPIIFLTAIATGDESSQRGGAIGGHPFVAKPVTVENLIMHIEKNARKK